MGRARVWLLVLLGGSLWGCQENTSQTYPNDPLLSNKKPIEARAENAQPVAPPPAAPSIPPVPPLVLATVRQAGRQPLTAHDQNIPPPAPTTAPSP
jgi:hypothetical protein